MKIFSEPSKPILRYVVHPSEKLGAELLFSDYLVLFHSVVSENFLKVYYVLLNYESNGQYLKIGQKIFSGSFSDLNLVIFWVKLYNFNILIECVSQAICIMYRNNAILIIIDLISLCQLKLNLKFLSISNIRLIGAIHVVCNKL